MTVTHHMMIIAVALVIAGVIYAKRRGGSGKLGFITFELSKPLQSKDAEAS